MRRRDPRLIEVPAEHRQLAAELIADHGIAEAARLAGLGRVSLLTLVGTGEVMRGTGAIFADFVRRRQEAA